MKEYKITSEFTREELINKIKNIFKSVSERIEKDQEVIDMEDLNDILMDHYDSELESIYYGDFEFSLLSNEFNDLCYNSEDFANDLVIELLEEKSLEVNLTDILRVYHRAMVWTIYHNFSNWFVNYLKEHNLPFSAENIDRYFLTVK